jgi:ketosteroid isomerase-like protein
VKLADQVSRVAGEAAYELGLERGQITLAGQQVTLDHRVTNIYRREPEGWKIVHHHTDIAPAMLDALNRLKAKT